MVIQYQITSLKPLLENTAARLGAKTAIIAGKRRVSYAELEETSNRIAHALIEMGVGRGDRVALMLGNTPEFVTTFFGIIKAGGVAVPLDTRYKVDEFASVINDCQPKVLIAESPHTKLLADARPRYDYVKHIIHIGAENIAGCTPYRELLAASPAAKTEINPAPDDTAVISYTSNNANRPKGAMLSHRALVDESVISAESFAQTEDDVVMLFALPLYHNFGLVGILFTSIYLGSTVVIVPGTGLSINTLMQTIEKEKGTMLLGVPYIFGLAATTVKREGLQNDLSSLRLCGSGGAPLSVPTIEQFRKHLGLNLLDLWGQTESMCQVTCQPVDGSGKLGSVGRALPGWEMKIVDDAGVELPANKSGEIIVRGPIMTGYYNNPEATAATIRDGWLHTGDIGRIDKDGYLFITGRKKRMIILKGQNIYPSEVEDILHTNLKIAEAMVMGIPDKLRGEMVKAFIRLKEGAVATKDEIRHFCLERMADYKLPRQIVFVKELPKRANITVFKRRGPRLRLSRLFGWLRRPSHGNVKP